MHWEERFPIFFFRLYPKTARYGGKIFREGGGRVSKKIFIINIYNGGAGGQGPKP